MTPRRRFLARLLPALIGSILPASTGLGQRQGPDPKENKVVGVIWAFRGKKVAEGKETGEVIEGKFRVFGRDIYRGPKKVGFVRPQSASESSFTITDWPDSDTPNMNGTIKMKKVGQRPAVWQGLFKRNDGTEWKLTVKFLQN